MFINGSLRIIYFKWNGEYLPVGCLTSDSFEESTEMLDTTTRDNNGWKTSTPVTQSYGFSFEGLIINTKFNGGDFNKISYDRLRDLKRNRTLIEWKMQDDKLTFIDTGFGYLTTLSDSSNVDEFITFSASVEGYGEPESTTGQSFTLTDGNDSILQDGNENEIITA